MEQKPQTVDLVNDCSYIVIDESIEKDCSFIVINDGLGEEEQSSNVSKLSTLPRSESSINGDEPLPGSSSSWFYPEDPIIKRPLLKDKKKPSHNLEDPMLQDFEEPSSDFKLSTLPRSESSINGGESLLPSSSSSWFHTQDSIIKYPLFNDKKQSSHNLKHQMLQDLIDVGLPNFIWDLLRFYNIKVGGSPLQIAKLSASYIAPPLVGYFFLTDAALKITENYNKNGNDLREACKSYAKSLTLSGVLIKGSGIVGANVGFETAYSIIQGYCGPKFTDNLIKACVTSSTEAASALIQKTLEASFAKCEGKHISPSEIAKTTLQTFGRAFLFTLMEEYNLRGFSANNQGIIQAIINLSNAALVGAVTSLTSTAASVFASKIGNTVSEAKNSLLFKTPRNRDNGSSTGTSTDYGVDDQEGSEVEYNLV